MDKSFSLYRVGLLIKRQWASFGRVFLIALGAVVLILISIYLYNLPTKENIYKLQSNIIDNYIALEFPIIVCLITGLVFLSLTSSWYFGKWGKKADAMEELLLPVSNIEKTICGILLTSIVCIGSYIIVFLLIDSGYRLYLNDFVKTLDKRFMAKSFSDITSDQYIHIQDCHAPFFINSIGSYKNFLLIILLGFLVQSMFLLGSIYFKRFQYIKTLITVAITVFIILFSTMKLGRYLNEGRVTVYHTLDELEHQNGTIPIFFYIIIPFVILIFYWITYLRVKEKEV